MSLGMSKEVSKEEFAEKVKKMVFRTLHDDGELVFGVPVEHCWNVPISSYHVIKKVTYELALG